MAMSKSSTTTGTANGNTGTASTTDTTSNGITGSRAKPATAAAAATVTCQAMVTVKGKPGRCDQPAAADRGGHAVCLKHDRAVWIEYVKITP
jgi:hypothetical protein